MTPAEEIRVEIARYEEDGERLEFHDRAGERTCEVTVISVGAAYEVEFFVGDDPAESVPSERYGSPGETAENIAVFLDGDRG